jgi:predicted DCC family thiol-disulfide oxidoreductase YuxK
MQAQQSIVVDPKSPGSIDSPHGLILFDGVCVLCSRGCGFVSKRDRRGYFRFVPMQLAEGRPLAEQLGINPDRPDSFAFVANGQASVKSEAVLRIARELPRWQWTWLFHFLPRGIRDEIYDLVARNRYRWFGRRDTCILPNSDRSWRSGTAPRLRDDGAWRRLAADRHDKGSGGTGALMAAFSPQERANYFRQAGDASK